MSAGILLHTMVVRNPDTMEAVALIAGTELPEWAVDLVHPDNVDGATSKSDGGSSTPTGWSSKTKPELESEVESRNADRDDDAKIVVAGKGNKPDLVAALEADDAAIAAAAAGSGDPASTGDGSGARADGSGGE